MRTNHIPLSFAIAAILMIPAYAQDKLPNLDQALRGGKLIHRVNPDLMFALQYEYGADTDFADLKNNLKESLGDGWTEKEVDPRVFSAMKVAMKKEGIDLIGYSIYNNPHFPDREITLSMKQEQDGEKILHIVDISGSWDKKAEQAGA